MLIILPGNAASSRCYKGELTYFSRWYHAVSFDYWGSGQSDRMKIWPEGWWTLAVQDTAALLDHLGQETGLVMSSSGGGIVACPDEFCEIREDFSREIWKTQTSLLT